MRLNTRALFFAATMVFITAEPLLAQRGGRGGGGRGGGGMRAGGGGGFRGGGGGGYRGGGGMRGGSPQMSRAAARPSVSRPASRPAVTPRPSAPAMSNFRPNVGSPAARPNVARTPSNIGQPGRRDVGQPGRRDIGQPGRTDLGQPGRPNAGLRPTNPIINNRPINNWDVDVDGGWGSGWGCCHYPVGAAAVGAAVGYAAADAWDDDDYVVGNVTYALPSECSVTTVNGITYQQCGSTWYEPQFVGDQVSYIVVSPPQ